jgi:hypothetical protein
MRYVPESNEKIALRARGSGIVVLSGAASAYEFSADAVMTDDGQTITGRIFAKAQGPHGDEDARKNDHHHEDGQKGRMEHHTSP